MKMCLLVQETTRGVAYWNDVFAGREKGMNVQPAPICSMSEQAGTGSRGRRYLFGEARGKRRCDELTRYIALTCSTRGHDQTQPCAKLHILSDHSNGSSKTA